MAAAATAIKLRPASDLDASFLADPGSIFLSFLLVFPQDLLPKSAPTVCGAWPRMRGQAYPNHCILQLFLANLKVLLAPPSRQSPFATRLWAEKGARTHQEEPCTVQRWLYDYNSGRCVRGRSSRV